MLNLVSTGLGQGLFKLLFFWGGGGGGEGKVGTF